MSLPINCFFTYHPLSLLFTFDLRGLFRVHRFGLNFANHIQIILFNSFSNRASPTNQGGIRIHIDSHKRKKGFRINAQSSYPKPSSMQSIYHIFQIRTQSNCSFLRITLGVYVFIELVKFFS